MRFILCTLLVLGAMSATPAAIFAADHLDSPSVEDDGRLDINDLYAFRSTTDASRTVLIMTVNPLAGVLSPATFNTAGSYEFNIDTDNDQVADLTYAVRFFDIRRGGQLFSIFQRTSTSSELVAVGQTGRTAQVKGGGMATADIFDDPFFFDLEGFQDGFNFTGDDFFAGANVSAIVLEVPSATIGQNIAVWARTLEDARVLEPDTGTQFDRMGRPAINTALIPDDDRKDAFNIASPVNDVRDFGDDVRATITALSGDADYAAQITAVLLPDVLTIDTSSGNGFVPGLNGRQLADDVIDLELQILTRDNNATDQVNANDVPFRDAFPYLGVAH